MARWILMLSLVACTAAGSRDLNKCPSSGQPLPDRCSETVGEGTTCVLPATPPQARDTSCNCQNNFWVCNSCPSDFMPPTGGACTPGDQCDWNSWEHGCSCACPASGHWSCAPVTIGTTECRTVDAGP